MNTGLKRSRRRLGGYTASTPRAWNLARVGGELATICQSFSDDDYGGASVVWLHESELLDVTTPGYDVNLVRPNRYHNVKTLVGAIWESENVVDLGPDHDASKMITDLASYALLDGLVGNTDRHHDNWMVAFVLDADTLCMSSAPSFDHASSLGRELTDARREQMLSANRVLDYLKRGRGGVFRDRHRRSTQASSPLRLAQILCRWRPELAEDWRERRLTSVPDSGIRTAITDRSRQPEFMTATARAVRIPSCCDEQELNCCGVSDEHPVYVAWQHPAQPPVVSGGKTCPTTKPSPPSTSLPTYRARNRRRMKLGSSWRLDSRTSTTRTRRRRFFPQCFAIAS